MAIHRVSNAITKRQHRNLVFLVVVVGKLDRPVEDGKQVRGVVPLRSGFWTMALQAKRIALGAQQVIVVAAVRRVAGGAALDECRLVVHGFLPQIIDVGMASEANVHGVGLGQPGMIAGVRAVAIRAIAGAPGCGTLAESISLALSSWQVTQSDLASVCVNTTLPSLAGAWQVSQLLASKGACWNFAISFGESDWCGSWHCMQFAVANGWL